MKLVIQRVSRASVTIDGQFFSSIEEGLLILVGIATGDTEEYVKKLAQKAMALRIFDDEKGVMNRSVTEVKGEVLAVSQFTLLASTCKGNRPSYIQAAPHELAIPLYELFCHECGKILGHDVKTGVFGAQMEVELVNQGPVTIVINSDEYF